jgi:hypothetical protein
VVKINISDTRIIFEMAHIFRESERSGACNYIKLIYIYIYMYI